MDRSENRPEVWEQLFPFEPRRELAQKFVEQASQFDFVQRIFAMQVGSDTGKHHQRIFVVSQGDEFGLEAIEDWDQIIKLWKEVCQGPVGEDILGMTPVITENTFLEDRQDPDLSHIRYREVTVLFDRQQGENETSLGTPLNLNLELN